MRAQFNAKKFILQYKPFMFNYVIKIFSPGEPFCYLVSKVFYYCSKKPVNSLLMHKKPIHNK